MLFLLAFIPGLLAIGLSFYLHDAKSPGRESKKPPAFFSFLHYWKQSPAKYRKLVIGLLVFTLGNSSDAFLLLKVKEAGLSDMQTIGVYIFYNLVYAVSAFPVGILADKIGLKRIFVTGVFLFALVYAGMIIGHGLYFYGALFLLYGLYASATEGISKAWISNISDKKDTATAIGTYTGLQSICTMLSSFLTGWIWFQFGSGVAFLVTVILAIIVLIYFLLAVPASQR